MAERDPTDVGHVLESYIRAGAHPAEQQRRRKLVDIFQGKWSLREGRIVLTGDLNLVHLGLADLEELPDICCVEGDFRVEDISKEQKANLKALPEGLRIEGTLVLARCSELTVLPKDLHVGGDFVLLGCHKVASFPKGLHVKRSLMIAECDALAVILNDLDVKGDIRISQCPALTTLPENLHVNGELLLEACLTLKMLPDILYVEDTFFILHCPGVTALAKNLRVQGDLLVLQCPSLAVLPDSLHVEGSLQVDLCALTELPKDIYVGENINLTRCPELAIIPKGLHVRGHLQVSECSAVAALPENLHVEGSLYVIRSAIAMLPEGLHVEGELDCFECLVLTVFPQSLHVGKSIRLRGCSALATLPKSLYVQGDLDLGGCSALKVLPGGLGVEGDLNLLRCSSLATLPEGLHVKGSLVASDCSALTTFPADFSVGQDLNLEYCRALESLPASILSWPEIAATCDDDTPDRGSRHIVLLGGSGLSQDTLEWLRAADAPNVQFHVDLRGISNSYVGDERRSIPEFTSVPEAISFWRQEAEEKPAAVSLNLTLSKLDATTVVQFLSMLRGAKEFGITETRRALARRVVKTLVLLDNPECRTEVLQRMEDSLDACHDKPIWALNQLSLVNLISSARGHRDELRALGRRVMHLQIVHDHVQKKIASLNWVDDVCVYLRFEIELREVLHLPVDATAMKFPDYIEISDTELKAAEQEALDVTEEAFESWLSSWTEWERQARLETVKNLRWEDLDMDESVRGSRIPRADLSGETLVDPVVLRGKVWSLRDLLRHWVQSGLDLLNTVLEIEELTTNLKRVKKRTSLRQSLRRSLGAVVSGKRK